MWGSIVDRSMFDSIHLCDSFIIRLFLFSTSKSCFIQRYEIVKCHNRWFSLHLSHNANETHTKDRHRDGQQRDREEAILATRPALASHNKTTTNRLVRHGHHDYQQEAVHRKADVLLPSVSVCTEKGMTQRSTSCLMAGCLTWTWRGSFRVLLLQGFLSDCRPAPVCGRLSFHHPQVVCVKSALFSLLLQRFQLNYSLIVMMRICCVTTLFCCPNKRGEKCHHILWLNQDE